MRRDLEEAAEQEMRDMQQDTEKLVLPSGLEAELNSEPMVREKRLRAPSLADDLERRTSSVALVTSFECSTISSHSVSLVAREAIT